MESDSALWIVLLASLCFAQAEAAKTRTFYLAAVEEDWDYAPNGNRVNDDTQTSDIFLRNRADRIGSVYRKVLYRQFTDKSFRRQVEQPVSQGMLGPILRAETGDTIVVNFRNMAMTANRSFSVHPHGVQYNKNAEGALYVDETTGSDKEDDGVAPGNQFRYVWRVLPSFAPTSEDDRCLPWAYHSHTKAPMDIDTGLVGLLLTCRKGTLVGRRRPVRRDVAAEFPIYLDTSDENKSWLLQQNLQKCGDASQCSQLAQSGNGEFQASNRMSHVNGRMFGNLQGLHVPVTRSRKPVAFYFFSLNRGTTGLSVSGQVFMVRNHRVNTIDLFPGTFKTGFLRPSNPGYWLLSNRNIDRFIGGQQAFLRITNANRKKRHAVRGRKPDLFLDLNAQMQGGLKETAATWLKTAQDVGPRQQRGSSPIQPPSFSSRTRPSPRIRASRTYYLGIEDDVWDYGPSGQDLYNGGSLTAPGSQAATYFTRGPQTIGGRYIKSRFVAFTDGTFSTRRSRGPAEEHLGLLGPVVMGEVGERVKVVVRNMASRTHSFLPHGVLFTKAQEGFVYRNPETNRVEGRVVRPGETTSYEFQVPSLGRDDLPCVASTYISAVDPARDINTGLIGPMLLCQRGQLEAQQTLTWPSLSSRRSRRTWFQERRHFFLNFFTVDENLSWHLRDNVFNFTTDPESVDHSVPSGTNRMHAINGLMFGNLQGLTTRQGDPTAWHVLGLGGMFDLHIPNFHGQTLQVTSNQVNAKAVVAGTSLTLESTPDTVGNWSVACRLNFHFLTGMVAKFEVQPRGFQPPTTPRRGHQSGEIRTYYIAAQEVLWDYAPLKRDLITGENFTNDNQAGYIFVKDDDQFIGTVYKKARYIQYTDASFKTQTIPRLEDDHLGLLGPVIKAEVGDVVRVVFFNNATRNYSMHPQGLQYDKDNEGAKYVDNASQSGGDFVAPGQTFVYTWRVPDRSGPGDNDPRCVAWMYYSSVNSVRDTYSGLVGPLLVCRQSTLRGPDLRRFDVDQEFWTLYSTFDENLSWYFEENVRERAPNRVDVNDPQFRLSNNKFTINGRIYGNVEGLVMMEGDVVAWYLMGLGNGYHPVHFHGQTALHRADRTHRVDVQEVFPSTTSVLEMLCDNPGTWIVHCHFSTHVENGMEATYTILPSSA